MGIALILLVAFTGNSDAIDPGNIQENAAVPAGEFSGSHTIGQTFTFHYPRLHAIQVRWIVSDDFAFADEGRVVLHIRRHPADSSDIASASIPVSAIGHNGFTKFVFAPLPDSQNRTYFFLLDASQAHITRGSIGLWASAANDYPGGQMYLDGVPTDRDLAFRAYYEPDGPDALGALRQILNAQRWNLFVALMIFIVPGLALVLLGSLDGSSHTDGLLLAGGLGLSLLSAATFALAWLGIPLQWLDIPLVMAALALVIVSARCVIARLRNLPNRASILKPDRDPLVFAILGGLLLLALAVSLLQMRDIVTPLWKDSPIHAQIIHDILAQGRLPAKVYHYGFHGVVAWLVQLSNMAIPDAMLLVGQLLNVQIGLSVFLLSKQLSDDRVAALAGAIGVWFLSPTPIYVVNWGRYTLLMGAALLPLALYLAVRFIDRPRWRSWTPVFVVVTAAGMAMAHIRLAAFYVVFIALYLAYHVWQDEALTAALLARLRALQKHWLGISIVVLNVAAAAWWLVWRVLPVLQNMVPQRPDIASSIDLSEAIAIWSLNHGPALAALALVGLLVAIARRKKSLILVAAYGVLLLVSMWPDSDIGTVYLPPSLVLLMGYLPVAVVAGDFVGWLYARTTGKIVPAQIAWVVAAFGVSLLGARDMISIVNPATVLFTGADQKAMTWIAENVPEKAHFLINSDLWFERDFSPVDGGWWITTTTGRSIVFWNLGAFKNTGVFDRWLYGQNIDWIYFGTHSGMLNRFDFICQPERYALVYAQDGVAILAVRNSSYADPVTVPLPAECDGYR